MKKAIAIVLLAVMILGLLAALSGVALVFWFTVTGTFPEISCARMLLFASAWALLSALAMLPSLKK